MKQRQFIMLIFLLAVFFHSQACGKKGPPFLPTQEIPFKVEPLEAECENGIFLLKGAVVDSKGQVKEVSNVTGCRVYHACYPLDNPPCEDCPIDFGEFQEIKGELITQGEFSCQVPVKIKKGVHFFRVRLIGQKGEIGPFSERARLIIEH